MYHGEAKAPPPAPMLAPLKVYSLRKNLFLYENENERIIIIMLKLQNIKNLLEKMYASPLFLFCISHNEVPFRSSLLHWSSFGAPLRTCNCYDCVVRKIYQQDCPGFPLKFRLFLCNPELQHNLKNSRYKYS